MLLRHDTYDKLPKIINFYKFKIKNEMFNGSIRSLHLYKKSKKKYNI